MKKTIAAVGAAVVTLGMLAGCSTAGPADDGTTTIKVAALQGGYGKDMYTKVIAAYEKANPDVDVDLTISKSIEDRITPQIKAGDFPDLVVLGQGREQALPESLVKDNALEDLTPVLGAKVPGEDVTVGDKLTEGIVGNLATDPYGDGKTYLMPMYYAPTGLFYNSALLEQKGWQVPTTWDEMWTLGDEAKAEGISLFTYPTAGYLDSYFYSLLADVGGKSFFDDVMSYKKGVWETADAKRALSLTTKLLSYAAPTTVGYANQQDFTKNQQSILDDETLFMPNGTWIAGEMADAPRSDGFTWGLTPLPTEEADQTRYITTSVESAWIPKAAQNKDAAERFLAYLYSDDAAAIFAASDAIQPISGISDQLSGVNAQFYSVYDQPDVQPVVGGFASTRPVPGVDIKSTLFDTANSIISGDKTQAQWRAELNTASNKLSQAKG